MPGGGVVRASTLPTRCSLPIENGASPFQINAKGVENPIQHYDVDPTTYIEGARYCLDQQHERYLAYAALEIRRFVEARQYEYLVAQQKYRSSMPKAHQIGKAFLELQRIYNGEKTQVITTQFEDGFVFEYRFIPISGELRNQVEKMGEWLHAPKQLANQKKIDTFRAQVESAYQNAVRVNSGNLLCPALITGTSSIVEIVAKISSADRENLKTRLKVGSISAVKVAYV